MKPVKKTKLWEENAILNFCTENNTDVKKMCTNKSTLTCDFQKIIVQETL